MAVETMGVLANGVMNIRQLLYLYFQL